MEFRKPVPFKKIIKFMSEYVKKKVVYKDFCVYSKLWDSDELTLETICYLDDYAEITDDNKEIFPQFVQDNNLEFLLMDELIESVIFNALHQKPDVTDEEILKAIQFYNDKDTFIDFK